MSDSQVEPHTRYKVGRVLSEYGLTTLHDELPARWRGDDGDATSLRELADIINITILRRAMEDAGEDPLEGEAENAYRLLTDDTVSAGVRTQQRNRLSRAGVDVDSLEADFITHQAVYTYLTNALDVSKETTSQEPLAKHDERIQRLRNRTAAVVENSLTELRQQDKIPDGEFDVLVDVQVYCNVCQTQRAVSEFLKDGGCDCQ